MQERRKKRIGWNFQIKIYIAARHRQMCINCNLCVYNEMTWILVGTFFATRNSILRSMIFTYQTGGLNKYTRHEFDKSYLFIHFCSAAWPPQPIRQRLLQICFSETFNFSPRFRFSKKKTSTQRYGWHFYENTFRVSDVSEITKDHRNVHEMRRSSIS